MGRFIKQCKHCHKAFQTNNVRQIYCCQRCREKQWVINNPEQQRKKTHLWRQNLKIFCRHCHKELSLDRRKGGVSTCSNECQRYHKLQKNREYRRIIYKKFAKYKKKIGCQRCGYNKNASCLDFHHINEKLKLCRITAKLWYAKTKLFKQEIEKCILVCKNCHGELHHPET